MDKKNIQTDTTTSTTHAVLLTVGMIGAFFVGLSMMFAMSRYLIAEPIKENDQPILPIYSEPMLVSDITGLNVGIDVNVENDFLFWQGMELVGVTKSGEVTFGDWNLIHKYQDKDAYGVGIPLAVKIWGNNHSAGIVTFQSGPYDFGSISTCSDTDPSNDPLIKGTVNGTSAGGEEFTYSDVCNFKDPNQLIQYNCDTNASGSESTPIASSTTCPEGCVSGACQKGIEDAPATRDVSLFGIDEVHAQITVGTKTSICIPEMVPSTVSEAKFYTYYVGKDGNLYYDQRLSARVNTVECSTILDKSFAPSNITDVSSNGNIELGINSYGTQGGLYFFKTINTILAEYDSVNGFTDGTYDAVGSVSPLMIYMRNLKRSTVVLDEQTVTVTSELGTKQLCLPDYTLEPNERIAFYYDTSGDPYTNVSLTDKVTCGETVIPDPVCTGAKTDSVECYIETREPAL